MISRIQIAGNFVLRNLEAFIWLSVIVYFVMSPINAGSHFTICPLNLAGFEHCPGCGLGRSMILLLHGRIAESFTMHPLAIIALVVFSARIVIVFRNYFQFQKQIKTTMN